MKFHDFDHGLAILTKGRNITGKYWMYVKARDFARLVHITDGRSNGADREENGGDEGGDGGGELHPGDGTLVCEFVNVLYTSVATGLLTSSGMPKYLEEISSRFLEGP